MPSHCSTDCNYTRYETKKLKVTDEEYERIKETLGKLEAEDKKKRKGQLEELLGDIQKGISQATSQLNDLKRQYQTLSKEYKQYRK